ncbi:uncharacterized protein LOC126970473 [Leptidea sinapis]|uniref:uncharacterized protein LOC126970473 n=1 Tax=Leptidea sinapis TaxID=189913 RepID=UPI0021C2D53F|nr:uncharacterized protein LOC126970473 [Leptidea sinapis]
MFIFYIGLILFLVPCYNTIASKYFSGKIECGPYGFVCDGVSRLRLCEEGNALGPAFLCPTNTICNEDSSAVCEDAINYIDPTVSRNVRCYHNERIADPNVPGCKGYIMCIPNKKRFQGIRFKCSGNTIFNGYTRACTSPDRYKCPLGNTTKTETKLYADENRKLNSNRIVGQGLSSGVRRPIECENYKFSLTDDQGPVRAAYFCPQRPVRGETTVRCTVFSNKFCLALERDDGDQFLLGFGSPFRRPRKN